MVVRSRASIKIICSSFLLLYDRSPLFQTAQSQLDISYPFIWKDIEDPRLTGESLIEVTGHERMGPKDQIAGNCASGANESTYEDILLVVSLIRKAHQVLVVQQK